MTCGIDKMCEIGKKLIKCTGMSPSTHSYNFKVRDPIQKEILVKTSPQTTATITTLTFLIPDGFAAGKNNLLFKGT